MLKLNTLKVLVLISIIFLSMGFISGSGEELTDLSPERLDIKGKSNHDSLQSKLELYSFVLNDM